MDRFRRATGGQRRNLPPPQSIPPYLWLPVVGVTGGVIYGYYAFLEEAPMTKRKRWIATSAEFERRLGDQEYQNLLKQFRKDILPSSHRASQTVTRVGSRVADAANNFAKQRLPPSSQTTSPYTFTVVRSDMANAFVLPNNHVFVMTGLFNFIKNEDDLAAVLGHEMAHNLARHAGEKMSGGLVISVLSRFLLVLDSSGILYSIFVPAATLLHDLPHSREAEVEADHIGIHLASHACYDPRAAKRVFSAMKGGDAAPPEFMSTHPSYDSRLSNFDKWMPEVLGIYEDDFKCVQIREEMAQARVEAALRAKQRESNIGKGNPPPVTEMDFGRRFD